VGWENPILIISSIIISLIALILAGQAWEKRNSPGSMSFALLMLAVCVWLVATGGSQGATTAGQKLFWAKVAYLGVSWLATLWLTFSLEFAYQHSRFIERAGWLLWIIPSLTILMILTNELHHWFWTAVIADANGSIIFHRGIPYWGFVVYNYALLIIGCAVLIRGLLRYPFYQNRQVAALILGMLLPWMANLSYVVGWLSQQEIDLTPFTFAVTGIIFAWTLFRMRLFDPVPLARDVIFEQMGEGYLAFDREGRILDCNILARRMLNLGSAPVAGRHYSAVLAQWPTLLRMLTNPESMPVEIHTGEGVLEASAHAWLGKNNHSAGTILILYDITQRHTVENQLRESEQRYRLLVNSSPVGIATLEATGEILFASPELLGLLGLASADALVGTRISDWIHADERQFALFQVEKASEGKEKMLPVITRIVRQDASFIWGEMTMTQLIAEDGESKRVVALVRDVTTQKELELRLQRNLEQQTFTNDLLQLVYHTQDLSEALQKALEMTGLFTRSSRVYVCRDSLDHLETTLLAEWCGEGIHPRAREGPLLRYAEVPTLHTWLENRGIVMISVDQSERNFYPQDELIPADLVEFTTSWNVLSFAAFPIITGEKNRFGFIGLDDCANPRKWSGEEIELLWNVCKIISGAVVQLEIEQAEKTHRLMTEALQDTAKAVTSTLNPEEVLDRVLANMDKVVQSDAASIAMVDEEGMVSFVRWRGYDEEGVAQMKNQRMHISERDTYRIMAQSGDPVIVADTWLDRRWKRQNQYSWIRSFAGAPIQVKGKIVGFLNLDSASTDFFAQDVIARLRVFADQVAVAIENARLYNLVHERAEQMSSLYRIGLSLTTGLEMEQVLSTLLDQCRQLLPIDIFYVVLYDAEHDRLSHGIFYQAGEYLKIEPRTLAKDPGVTGVVIRERRTVVIADSFQAEAEGKYKPNRFGGTPARAYVAVPLIMFDQVVGVISMQNFKPNAYSTDQVRLLETIATQAAVMVQNARMYEQMRQMAITDSVTQLFTRRHFTLLGHNEIERSQRYKRTASVLMVDIDRFKRVNDTYGHLTGDTVLQMVARICSQALRATDIVGRWGGEEFTIVLPEAEREGALMIAERIRRMVEECTIPLPDGRTIKVTVSLGVATLSATCTTLEGLVDCADRAMYAAKDAGRNQVKVYDETMQIIGA
jgi:diguanylate cyclase (GGDEF)-like protein/PAS domain S-box-containing protein